MAVDAIQRAGGLAYREAVPEGVDPAGAPVALLLHGYPESSYMWREAMPAIAEAGWRAVAPDLPGYGDSQPDPPGTWERHVEAVERFRWELGLERVALVVHDWGGLIGLRWACDNPGAARALVVSCTGFFPDGKWHGLARAMRAEGQGEEMMENMTREAFGAAMRQSSAALDDEALDEYWKGFADEARRRGHLELYRSGDFEKLHAYEGRLAALGVPALILWGAGDPFAPIAGAHRFHRDLPDSKLVTIENAGHFVVADAPTRFASELATFLGELDHL